MQSTLFPSANAESQCHAGLWMPEGSPLAVVQLVHGMSEHLGCYDDFARYLNLHDIAVCGTDHPGHGKSAATPEDYGWFGERDGAQTMCDDLHTLRQEMQQALPGVPYFLLGHSMGSYVLRQYLASPRAEGLAGALFSGAGDRPSGSGAALLAARWLRRYKGERYISEWLNRVLFSGHNKRIPAEERQNLAWLSRDPQVVAAYTQDPACGFPFPTGSWVDLLALIRRVTAPGWYRAVPADLPLFFFSGDADPTGQYGKGVRRVCDKLRHQGAGPVRLALYPGGRHNILAEVNRDQVWQDILDWLLDVKNAGQ